jgi:hypothetical protein
MRPQSVDMPALGSLVNDIIQALKVPGISIAIIDGDDVSIQVQQP